MEEENWPTLPELYSDFNKENINQGNNIHESGLPLSPRALLEKHLPLPSLSEIKFFWGKDLISPETEFQEAAPMTMYLQLPDT